ncbi:endonuclease/exonuclease/phosphatase family protein [Nocardiopsis sp. JB363]|uniref:endonuclease/exonuclease/phosphatase family protein n=1 Tax=Nocardiopsis sp. JB363 TaxID=1434837 RepID=UPI00097A7DB2|nr:endonuclease/exonuclease/phosphatase family protein [Nocardiopsis sp. JB363]SIO87343.1 Integral membrane protein [Nocardiopsis sp. JB363]
MEQSQSSPVAPGRRTWVTVLVALVAAGFVMYALTRALGLERGFPLVPLLAYAPLVLSASPVALVAALLLRRWWSAAAVLIAGVLLATAVLPRAFEDGVMTPEGPTLRLLTLNVYFGEVSPEHIVDLVREHEVELLTLQEATPELSAGLNEAGLGDLLPHTVDRSAPGAGGGSVHSVYPLTDLGEPGQDLGSLGMPHAALEVPETSRPLEVVSVHPMPPQGSDTMTLWRDGLRALPPASDDTVRILSGDFNATLDHAEMRGLLDRGYADAADRLGMGFTGTWPVGGTLPKATIDHVLVDDRVSVDDLEIMDVPGSDHRALVTGLTLPGDGA